MTFDSAWNTFWMVMLRLGALCLGGYIAYTEVSGTYEQFMLQEGAFVYFVKMMIGIPVFTAFAPALMAVCWSHRHWGRLAAILLALPVCIVIVFSAAVGRMGGAADNSEQQRVKNARALELARKSETEATDALANATAEAKKE